MTDAESIASLSAKVERLEALLLRVLANQEAEQCGRLSQPERQAEDDKALLARVLPLIVASLGFGGTFTTSGLLRNAGDELRNALTPRYAKPRSLGKLLARAADRPIEFKWIVRRQDDSGRCSEGEQWRVESVFPARETHKPIDLIDG